MFVVRNYVTMCGTVACALGIGYLMQNGPSAQRNAAQAGIDVASASEQSSVLSGLEDIVLTSATPSDAIPGNAPPVPRGVPSAVRPTDCNISARATAVPGAMARLTLKAPCNAEERVEVHHSGLTVSQMTDTSGALQMTIPALSEYAIFLISFEDETGTVATTHVSDIAKYNRVALQWQGETELQIHALEFGASYGGDGHVWDDASAQGTGDIVRLGQQGLSKTQNIEVYSFPSGASDRSGTINLTVEAEVTEANCGHTLNVQALELLSDRRLRSRDMSLDLPDCSHAGEFLVLNNLLSDLTIAAK
ncbi:hypothetical protein [Ruegeria sp. HKCCD4332]|uniref:hypothetical protein n=1 Tax=Ruegeria sp. HKCCD4332 TaxID=2683021 RepID=UPI0014917866|nr:hypothetical protein [Ruegeria sp. HKCCD4332]NOD76130.1 hypothetical protein [Ruegeria sp. HKCCD4332]